MIVTQDDYKISFKNYTLEELLQDKDFLKILNSYWDKRFYGYKLEKQEQLLQGYLMDIIVSQPKFKKDKKMQDYFRKYELMCRAQLLRVDNKLNMKTQEMKDGDKVKIIKSIDYHTASYVGKVGFIETMRGNAIGGIQVGFGKKDKDGFYEDFEIFQIEELESV